MTASGDTVFKSTSFNEGKGDYHTRCYYTDITNASREAGVVEQHLLRGFLSAWLGAGQPLSNWTFYTLQEDTDKPRIHDTRGGQKEADIFEAQQAIVPFVYIPNYPQVYAAFATQCAAIWTGVNLSSTVQNQGQ